MSKIVDIKLIRSRLEPLRCPVHHRPADITVNSGVLHLATCCSSFKARLRKIIDEELATQIDKHIRDTLDKL